MFSCVNLDNVQFHKFELDVLMHHILSSTTSISNAIYSNISTQPLNVFSYLERRLELYDIRNSETFKFMSRNVTLGNNIMK